MNPALYARRRKPKLTEAPFKKRPLGGFEDDEDFHPHGTLGLWAIPNGGRYEALLIPASYTTYNGKRGDVPTSAPGDPLFVNWDLLNDHFPWIDNIIAKHPKNAKGLPACRAMLTAKALIENWSIVINADGKTNIIVKSLERLPHYFKKLIADLQEDELSKFGVFGDQPAVVHDLSGATTTLDKLMRAGGAKPSGDQLSLADEVEQLKLGNLESFDSKDFLKQLSDNLEKLASEDRETGIAIRALLDMERRGAISREQRTQYLDKLEKWGGEDLVAAAVDRYDSKFMESIAQRDGTSLVEMTLSQLVKATQRNGTYAHGGLVRVGSSWYYDPGVPGRAQNARYVFANSPSMARDEEGQLMLKFRVQSRRDRNTTGVAQTGFIKFINPKKLGIWRRIVRTVTRPDQFNQDVHCFCTCPDFKFKSHYVLAKNNSAHTPTGIGGEATNEPPVQTNPQQRVMLCKHLLAVVPYVQMSLKKLDDLNKDKEKGLEKTLSKKAPAKKPDPALKSPEDDSKKGDEKVKPGQEVEPTAPVKPGTKPRYDDDLPQLDPEDPEP